SDVFLKGKSSSLLCACNVDENVIVFVRNMGNVKLAWMIVVWNKGTTLASSKSKGKCKAKETKVALNSSDAIWFFMDD
ncbi:hypothetical protein HAX54_008203, partial [Datura stramonium]|nr:hypothetical protein [Datura stramonium]